MPQLVLPPGVAGPSKGGALWRSAADNNWHL